MSTSLPEWDPEHFAYFEQGPEAWNRWRQKNPNLIPMLAGVDLTGRDLRAFDLVEVRLTGASLAETDLRGVSLSGSLLVDTQMNKADLSDAQLHFTHLHGAKLNNVQLVNADLTDAIFSGSDLSGANLGRATLQATIFSDTNLSNVNGLGLCEHLGPSFIDIRTLQRSGPLPDYFLQGLGLPDNLITYAKSLIGSAIEFYSLFISYSTKDQDFANCLYDDLRKAGVRCWFAPHDAQGGRKLHEQIDKAIRLHDRLLLILSPHSVESEWVKTEISKARKREVREKVRVLFPIRLASFELIRDWECFDADTGKDSAREIREYFIPDFSCWKDHDSYRTAFDQLMRDLQTSL